jgi:hypothetical protein
MENFKKPAILLVKNSYYYQESRYFHGLYGRMANLKVWVPRIVLPLANFLGKLRFLRKKNTNCIKISISKFSKFFKYFIFFFFKGFLEIQKLLSDPKIIKKKECTHLIFLRSNDIFGKILLYFLFVLIFRSLNFLLSPQSLVNNDF